MRKCPLPVMLGAHLIAAPMCFALLAGIPLIILLAGVVVDDDPGGPLFLPIFAVGCIVFAVMTCLVLGVVTCGLQVLLWWRQLPSWLPLVGGLLAAFVLVAPLTLAAQGGLVTWLVCSISGGIVFACYWLALLASQVVLWRIHRVWFPL